MRNQRQAFLRQTRSSINKRNSLPQAVVNARAKYVAAVVQFLNGNFRGGSSDLAKALSHFQTGSLWLYRLNLANKLIATNKISQRQADQLYSTILRDPTELDWKTDPLEAIAFLASAHVGPMQLLFDIVADRKDHQRALEIGDMVRRHRFFSNLPLGGRLMAFRWVMHAPVEALSGSAAKQRANFMNRNPAYRASIARTEEIRKELIQLPIQPEPRSEAGVNQTKLLKELATISETQEAILASFALRREPAEMVFPPQGRFTEFQDAIDRDQLALVTLETGAGIHMYLVGSDRLQYVGLLKSKEVGRAVGKLLKELGVGGAAIAYKDLLEEEWKETAGEIKTKLFGANDDAWKRYKELVIVPDGALWYLPFEALPVQHEDQEKYLSDIVDIRYCPSMFMAFGIQRPQQPVVRSVVVTARMHSRGEAELSSREFGNLARELPDVTRIEGQLRIPSNYLGTLFDQLVVWSDMKAVKSPLALLPMQIDKDKNSNSIANWMSLPWRGPEHVAMPGFNSDGGAGMRGGSNGGDLFLTTMGMLASGTRTTLISRWATGGKTSLDLTRKYAESLPTKGPIKSAQISRQATRELDVDFENEPRVRVKKSDAAIKAEHPFFWAAHMLVAVQDSKRRVVGDEMEKGSDEESAVGKNGEKKVADDDAAKSGGDPKAKADEKSLDGKKSGEENPDNKETDEKTSDEKTSDEKKADKKKSAA